MSVIYWGFWLVAAGMVGYAIWQLIVAFYHWLWPDGIVGDWRKS